MNARHIHRLAVAAGLVIVALTAGAFALSYAHLADVAGEHGMTQAWRRWTWPGCLDAFIVAGELLMLRAALQGSRDWWAIGLTVAGSGGSIALNVAGVGAGATPLDHVVAGVPPTAALLAFGALMRQIHQAVHTAPVPAVSTPVSGAGTAGTPLPEPRHEAALQAPSDTRTGTPAGYALPAGQDRFEVRAPWEPEDDGYAVPDPLEAVFVESADELVTDAAADFADLITQGAYPSIRQLRSTYSIGQERATRIQKALAALAEAGLDDEGEKA